MAISLNLGYLNDALGRLPHQFKNKPRVAGWIQALMQEIQLLENQMWAVFVQRLLQNNPSGDLLDKIGFVVGQPREGFNDAQYRILIQARIKTNRSDGRHETLIDITSLLINMDGPIRFRTYLKALEIELTAPSPVSPYIIWHEFLQRAKVAGDRLTLFFSMAPQNQTLLRTSVSGGVTTVSTQRKGSVSVGGIGGGVFAGAFG